eukprot:GEMP01043945.1.p1 GENE.GEMP01043945.1~~GEMP01043945.1.p1  ORF type:complete len:253 (+),score=45.47 GEMP01043945.1:176-934(+)
MECPAPDSSPLVPPGEFAGIMPHYDDTSCHDKRFTPAIRREVELKCCDILEKSDDNLRTRSAFSNESNASSSTSPPEYAHCVDTCSSCTLKFDLLNDDGPVALLKRFVVDACTDADSTTEWRVFLGLSTVSDGTVGISSATFDFPWLTLLLNRWIRVLCHASSDERQDASIFSSWELLFPAAADKEAHSTVTTKNRLLQRASEVDHSLPAKNDAWSPDRGPQRAPAARRYWQVVPQAEIHGSAECWKGKNRP